MCLLAQHDCMLHWQPTQCDMQFVTVAENCLDRAIELPWSCHCLIPRSCWCCCQDSWWHRTSSVPTWCDSCPSSMQSMHINLHLPHAQTQPSCQGMQFHLRLKHSTKQIVQLYFLFCTVSTVTHSPLLPTAILNVRLMWNSHNWKEGPLPNASLTVAISHVFVDNSTLCVSCGWSEGRESLYHVSDDLLLLISHEALYSYMTTAKSVNHCEYKQWHFKLVCAVRCIKQYNF